MPRKILRKVEENRGPSLAAAGDMERRRERLILILALFNILLLLLAGMVNLFQQTRSVEESEQWGPARWEDDFARTQPSSVPSDNHRDTEALRRSI